MQRQKYKEKINSARKSRKSFEDNLLMLNFAAKFKYRIYETIERILCLVMFNRVAHQEYVTSHNITSIMGKSRKKTPVYSILKPPSDGFINSAQPTKL